MKFKVLGSKETVKKSDENIFYLIEDNWDDWFKYETTYNLKYHDKSGELIDVGILKIGQKSQTTRKPEIPKEFTQLKNDFFSLGQEDTYYENLNKLESERREQILKALNDLAINLESYSNYSNEEVLRTSLFRSVTYETLKTQFNRMAHGGARLTHYNFSYQSPDNDKSKYNTSLTFEVIPESNPPTNIHVLIGRNGVGKTHLLNNMVMSLLNKEQGKKYGIFSNIDFANLVLVSFSAFDQKYPADDRTGGIGKLKYTYVGLSKPMEGQKILPPKGHVRLKNEFVQSAIKCRNGKRSERWKKALLTLESDPIFQEADISSLCFIENKEDFEEQAGNLFLKLSSGHKIVLLTTTRLVETAEEKSLVLLDEPECHLHPPLLSAFIRALSDLLIQRNGVALIATHSPVILQEVPKSCVWKINRSGIYTNITRLNLESFGESIGTLSSEVFGLELTHSGFHNILKNISNETNSYQQALALLQNQIGSEGKAVLMALTSSQGRN